MTSFSFFSHKIVIFCSKTNVNTHFVNIARRIFLHLRFISKNVADIFSGFSLLPP